MAPQTSKDTAAVDSEPSVFTRLKQWIKGRRSVVSLQAFVKHIRNRNKPFRTIYDDSYFNMVDRTSGACAKIMAQSIVQILPPVNVIDVGCGTGNLISELEKKGAQVLGLEYAPAAIERCQAKGLEVVPFDITDSQYTQINFGTFSLAVSLEVAHQLPPHASNELVRFLCRHSDTVLFSSPSCAMDRYPRSPFPREHWILRFEECNYCLDEALSQMFKEKWTEAGTAFWFFRDPMIFRSRKQQNDT